MVDGVKHTYQYVGGLLMYETRGDLSLSYDYDAYGHLSCIRYMWADGSCWKFYVACNSRGDVTTIYAGDGTLRAKYTYDSWGNTLSIIDRYGNDIAALGDESIAADNIGALNRIRYRGYYYDFESGLYYLQSRYYDPGIGRFLNADGYVSTGQGLTGTNMFAYCLNNPIIRMDFTGTMSWNLLYERARRFTGAETSASSTKNSPNETKEEFSNVYKNATGKEYNFNYSGTLTVEKSITTVSRTQSIFENLFVIGIGILICEVAPYAGIPAVAATIASGVISLGASQELLGVGSYPTYTVTKTKYVTHQIEVANYRGYKVYGFRDFRYVEVETYIFLNGEIASTNYYVIDDYLRYELYNKYKNHF